MSNKTGAIWLRHDYPGKVVVCMECDGVWVTLIEEHHDSPFSHIIEPSGIEAKLGRNPFASSPPPLPIEGAGNE